MAHIVADVETWYIIPDIEGCGRVDVGQNISSPFDIETFTDEGEWLDRLDVLGIELPEEL